MSGDVKKIVVVGPGSMGCLFASMLKAAGHDVWLMARTEDQAAWIREHGLCIEKDGIVHRIPWPNVSNSAECIGTADMVFICVKAYDTEKALNSVLLSIDQHTLVITLQNGLGHIEIISRYVPLDRIIAGVTAHGATLLAKGYVRHAGAGETFIGAVHPEGASVLPTVLKLLIRAGIQTTAAENISSVLWGKLLVNAGINPLTAIFRIRNGGILGSEWLEAIMGQAVQEGQRVAEKLGIKLPYADPLSKALDVCHATAENLSSMCQDIRAGRKTEIDFINGAIVRYGKEVQIPTPVNNALVFLVKAISQ